MYLLSPFILQNLKRIFRADPELSGCAIFRHKMTHLSWTKIFHANQYYYFHLLVGPFHCAKFTKNSYSRSKVVNMHHFWTQNGLFAPAFLGVKIIKSFSSNYSPLSLFKISKKSFQRIQTYADVQFLDKKLVICPNENFFRKPVNEPCSLHSCLSACQKSKWDINLLVKYWRDKNTEISLAESHFWL